jgi:hypothetical protein
MNETSSNAKTYPKGSDDVNQPHDQSKQNGTGIDENNEEGIGDAADSKQKSMVTHSLNSETALASKDLILSNNMATPTLQICNCSMEKVRTILPTDLFLNLAVIFQQYKIPIVLYSL